MIDDGWAGVERKPRPHREFLRLGNGRRGAGRGRSVCPFCLDSAAPRAAVVAQSGNFGARYQLDPDARRMGTSVRSRSRRLGTGARRRKG